MSGDLVPIGEGPRFDPSGVILALDRKSVVLVRAIAVTVLVRTFPLSLLDLDISALVAVPEERSSDLEGLNETSRLIISGVATASVVETGSAPDFGPARVFSRSGRFFPFPRVLVLGWSVGTFGFRRVALGLPRPLESDIDEDDSVKDQDLSDAEAVGMRDKLAEDTVLVSALSYDETSLERLRLGCRDKLATKEGFTKSVFLELLGLVSDRMLDVVLILVRVVMEGVVRILDAGKRSACLVVLRVMVDVVGTSASILVRWEVVARRVVLEALASVGRMSGSIVPLVREEADELRDLVDWISSSVSSLLREEVLEVHIRVGSNAGSVSSLRREAVVSACLDREEVRGVSCSARLRDLVEEGSSLL